MRKLMYLSIACAAFLFASCGGGSNQSNSTEDSSSKTETTAPEESGVGASIPGIDAVQLSNTINLTGNDQMKFDQTLFKVKAGEPVTLTLKNIGKLPAQAMSHDVVVLPPGSDVTAFGTAATQARDIANLPADKKDKIIAHTKMLGPGEEDKITFTLSDTGVYEFLCTFPGHYATMQGKIVAE